ncbi:hypothetical protein KA005_44635 [bacterium]|nr:hypothetical protein [bacterium]
MMKIEMSDFDTLTNACRVIEECIKKLDEIYNKTDQHFNDGTERFWHNPFEFGCRSDVKNALDTAKTDITSFVISEMDKTFTNLSIDRDDVESFVFGNRYNETPPMGKFDVKAIVKYILNKYKNEEDETLKQLEAKAASCIKSFEGKYYYNKIESIDDFVLFSKSGLELVHSAYGHGKENATSCLLKLIEIELCDVNPSEAQEFYVRVGTGLCLGYVEQVKAFKNGKLKITFNSTEDRIKVMNMMLSIVK